MNFYHKKTGMKSILKVNTIYKSFNNKEILSDISFHLNENHFLTILGPSGCGKSTLLHIVAGLLAPDSGEIYFQQNCSTNIPGLMSYMHQKDLLLPWKNVVDNITISLRLKGIKKKKSYKLVSPFIELFGLKGFEQYYPSQLSGGMRQRASLLRTYLYQSSMMLLDEPLGALDAITRQKMHKWLLEIIEKINTTVLLVTHDIDEAVLLSDEIIVLSQRPAMIIDHIIVNLPRPRKNNMQFTDDFLQIKQKVINLLSGMEMRNDFAEKKPKYIMPE